MSLDKDVQLQPGSRSSVPPGKNRFEKLQDQMVTRRIDTNELVSDAFDDDVDHAVFDFERLPQLLEASTSDTTRSLFPQPVIDEDVVAPPFDDRHWLDGQVGEGLDPPAPPPARSSEAEAPDKVVIDAAAVRGSTLLGLAAPPRQDVAEAARAAPDALQSAARPAKPPLIPRLRTEPADVVASWTLQPSEARAPTFSQASVTLLELEVGELASDEIEISDPELARRVSLLEVGAEVTARLPSEPEPSVLPPQPEAVISEPAFAEAKSAEPTRAEPAFAEPVSAEPERCPPASRARELLPPPALPTHYGTARRTTSAPRAARRRSWLSAAKVLGYVLLAAAAGAGLGFVASM